MRSLESSVFGFSGTESQPGRLARAKQGHDAERLTVRIARDHPTILEKMKAGDFSSVHVAALDAGIIAPEFSIPLDPAGAAWLVPADVRTPFPRVRRFQNAGVAMKRLFGNSFAGFRSTEAGAFHSR
jgi:hypothetical protein